MARAQQGLAGAGRGWLGQAGPEVPSMDLLPGGWVLCCRSPEQGRQERARDRGDEGREGAGMQSVLHSGKRFDGGDSLCDVSFTPRGGGLLAVVLVEE